MSCDDWKTASGFDETCCNDIDRCRCPECREQQRLAEETNAEDLAHWRRRGQADAKRGRNALMWPTASGGVHYDINPPDDFAESDEEARAKAKAYYDGWCASQETDAA